MEDKFPKAYKEVLEILRYLPKESVEKIPQNLIEMFKEKMDNTYEFEIDINKDFQEQELLEETKAILANIYRDYLATPEVKANIEAKERHQMQILEEEKRKKYNPDVFKNRK